MRLLSTSLLLILMGCPTSDKDSLTDSPSPTDADGDGVSATEDCDDNDPSTYPGATENCDSIDHNCDGDPTDGATDLSTWYEDQDGDGYGGTIPVEACEAPSGMVAETGDCNDTDPAYHPGATENDCEDPNDYNCDGSTGYADADADGFAACVDCNDNNAAVQPDATETCNNIDDNCDGQIDNNPDTGTTYYYDGDGDGHGRADVTALGCSSPPEGYATYADDCNDTDPNFYPGAPEICRDIVDYNCDGIIGGDDLDGDGYQSCEDCDDSNAAIHPGATEICNSIDDDCDGLTDPGTAIDAHTWYTDGDGDGYGDATTATTTCAQPAGTVSDNTDCDDTDPRFNPAASESNCNDPNDYNCDGSTGYTDNDGDGYAACEECDDGNLNNYPGANEYCDGVDNNCDNVVDENTALDASLWYLDVDHDLYGDAAHSYTACDAPNGYVADDTDCDDAHSNNHPNANEYCDSVDNNCDGVIDEDSSIDASTWYLDVDGDSHGDPSVTYRACSQPSGYATDALDCNDANPFIYGSNSGGAAEHCDGIDEDCDGTVDDNAVNMITWYQDNDGDTIGSTSSLNACNQPAGYVASTGDCDDTDRGDYPGAPEITANGDDENCDGTELCYDDDDNDGYLDSTGDTRNSADTDCLDANEGSTSDPTTDCNDAVATVYPGATEVVGDSIDQNCDGGETCYDDDDNDGYLDTTGDTLLSADTDCSDAYEGTTTDLTTDCDDTDSGDYPGATETVGNGDDENCDGTETCYDDDDNDGYLDNTGDTRASSDTDCLDAYEGSNTDVTTDCDDTDSGDHPGAVETTGNGDDEDCDGTEICYDDDDNDGYLDNTSDTRVSTDTDCLDIYEGTITDLTTDCDDNDSGDHPGATETVGNGDDEDCDGVETCYDDDDNDGYLDNTGDTRLSTDTDCADNYEGLSSDPTTDCDDTDSGDHPGATETVGNGDDEDCDGGELCYDDDDNDGYLDSTGDTRVSNDTDCADINEGTATDPTTDCNDALSSAYPGAPESIDNGVDEDCDGGDTCYDDDDNDGYLDSTGDTRLSTDTDCLDAYEGRRTDATTDCNDTVATIYPGAAETVGDGIDQNCDGGESCYDDDDNDGYLDSTGDTRVSADTDCLDANEGTNTDLTTDCDDTDSGDYPGAAETVGNGDDENCDGSETCYDDDDNDGYLDSTGDTRVSADTDCADIYEGTNTDLTTDCNDAVATIYPGAAETVGDGIDQSCNGSETCYDDDDNDGYLDSTGDTRVSADTDCLDANEGTNTDLTTDCNDAVATIYPGATEIVADGIDQNCDLGDTCYDDDDNDGYLDNTSDTRNSADLDCLDAYEGTASDATTDCDDAHATVYVGAAEVCEDTFDNDCDGIDDCEYLGTETLPSVLAGLSTSTAGAFGSSIEGGLDVTGDGYPDVVVGDPYLDGAKANEGAAYVFAGATTFPTTARATISLAGNKDNAYTGQGIALLPDIDNDNDDELIVSAYGYASGGGTNYGKIALYRGGNALTGALSNNDASIVITGSANNELTGATVEHLGDIVGNDGISDWAFSYKQGLAASEIHIVSGALANATNYTPTNSTTYTITGSVAYSGYDIADDFDRGGDGISDLVMFSASDGKVYMFDGRLTANDTTANADVTLNTNAALANYNAARMIANAGDYNHDGYEDLIVGNDGIDTGATADTGSAFLYLGPLGNSSTPSLTVSGSTASDWAGRSVDGAGDVDHDTYDDLLIGIAGMDNTYNGSGEAILVYGPLTGTYTLTSSTCPSSGVACWYGGAAARALGQQLSGVGDLDGDNFDDFILAAPGYKSGSLTVGGIYPIYGTAQ